MTYSIDKLAVLLIIGILGSNYGRSQDSPTFKLSSQVHKVYPSLSISKEALIEAKTISDLHQYFKTSWVKSYDSVEIITIENNNKVVSQSTNDQLTTKQLKALTDADINTDISVIIRYLPDNNLRHNELKEYDFTFKVEPEIDASYEGGELALMKYLTNNGMDYISQEVFELYQVTAIKFTVDTNGKVVESSVVESSNDEQTDKALLAAVCSMPDWQPASYANGLKIEQEYVWTVGDSTSCAMNLLGIRNRH